MIRYFMHIFTMWGFEMEYSEYIIFIIEIIGTIACAISGAMVGIKKHMDLFGVNVLGITTAVGGGLIRDLILSIAPPAMFRNKVYALTAIATATVTFYAVYLKEKKSSRKSKEKNQMEHLAVQHLKSLMEESSGQTSKFQERYDRLLFFGDTVGLGVFTVMGSYTAIEAGYGDTRFLAVFVGVLTGVGGGMIRDVLAGNTPFILVKHIYAVASLAGALAFVLLFPYLPELQCMLVGALIVVVIRILAAHYRWNLPRIP